MASPFIGEIQMFGFNFAPRGWGLCNGQLLAIDQYDALFALIGTTYGGDGISTFQLPDLRGRMPVHYGQGPGLSTRFIGQSGGSETVTLISSQMPQHTHTAQTTITPRGQSGAATTPNPVGAFPAASAIGEIFSPTSDANGGSLNTNITVNPAGGNQPHENMSPYLCVNFCMALEGIFPSRN